MVYSANIPPTGAVVSESLFVRSLDVIAMLALSQWWWAGLCWPSMLTAYFALSSDDFVAEDEQ